MAGHSAGAAIVHHLALTNRTENLFDKIITHSGSANAPWAIHTAKYSKIRYITIAIELGCTTNRKIMEVDDPTNELSKGDQESIIDDDMKILNCLRKKNPEDIIKMLSYFVGIIFIFISIEKTFLLIFLFVLYIFFFS